MNVCYKDGKIEFDFEDLLRSLDEKSKLQAAEHLACHDEIIKHVVDQILDGFTEDGSRGYRCFLSEEEPETALDWACREIAKRSSEVAKKEIEILERSIKKYNEENMELRAELYDFRARNC